MALAGRAVQTARPAGHPWLRRTGALLGRVLAALLLIVVAYAMVTTPPAPAGRTPLTAFDPETVGRLEQRAWAAYYDRQWPQLFDLMLRMTRSVFGLSLPRAVYASYLNTQAQVTWARQGESDGQAEAYVLRFYEFVRKPAGGRYDSAKAARLEVRWWHVHRTRELYPDRSALARALAATYAEVYQVPIERVLPAGDARAEAMDLSDRWVREGKDPNSPLLEQIAERLVASYRSLSEAVETLG